MTTGSTGSGAACESPLKYFAFLSDYVRYTANEWRHPPAYDASSLRAADSRYGCNFILKPTTPGSSVLDTAKPHDFASEIIAEFSRSASPIIQAVPRERA